MNEWPAYYYILFHFDLHSIILHYFDLFSCNPVIPITKQTTDKPYHLWTAGSSNLQQEDVVFVMEIKKD
jgi:hypothetical protein